MSEKLPDREYFRMRQREAEQMARVANDPAVARAHRELAKRYEVMLAQYPEEAA